MDLVEELENLTQGGGDASRFRMYFFMTIRHLRTENTLKTPNEIREEIEAYAFTHPFLTAIVGLSRWVESREYHDGARLALNKFTGAYAIAIDEGWNDLALLTLRERLRLCLETNDDHRFLKTTDETLFFLNWKDELSIGWQSDVLEILVDQKERLAEDQVTDLLSYLENEARERLIDNQFRNSRIFWRLNLEVRKSIQLDLQIAQQGLIDSYEANIEELRGGQHIVRGTVAKEGLVECVDWLDEETRVKWEQEFLESNQMAIPEMGLIEHKPTREQAENLDQAIEGVVDGIQETRRDKSGPYAIKLLINLDFILPPGDSGSREEFSIMDLVQSQTMTSSGASFAQDESSGEWTSRYAAEAQFRNNIIQSLMMRLINRHILREGDFFLLFWQREELSGDNQLYLTDFIIDFFDNRGPQAVFIGMPQLESVLKKQMEKYGKSTLRVDKETGELYFRSLSNLLTELEGNASNDWLTYMRYFYTDLSGQSVRQKIAHGELQYSSAQWGMACIILIDLLRVILELETVYEAN